MARQLDISQSAAKNIIYKYDKTGLISVGKHGGHRKPIINDEIGQFIMDYVEENPQSTLAEMKKFMQDTKEINVSESTISRFLTGKLITLKKIKGSVQEKNSDRVKELRFQYVGRFLDEGWRMSQCIFIDEIGFNLWTTRKFGRSKRGLPAYTVIPTNRGKNMSLIMAIGKHGPLLFKLYSGSVDHVKYQDFISELSSSLPGTPHYLIHDNARIHGNTISNFQIINLPPYSPFLNPIEAFFAKLKRDLRTEMTNYSGLLSMSHQERQAALKDKIEAVAAKEEHRDMRSYYRHVKKFFKPCLLKQDIHGD